MHARGGTIGPYRVLRHWATGDTSHVYVAQREGSSTLVAIKSLAADHQTGEDRARFRKEADLAQKVHHGNIVDTLEVIEHRGEWAIAMELLHGETLHDMSRLIHPGRRMPAALALEVVRGLALALHQIHELGAIHGDVCPANVIITHDGRVKLIDLGGKCEGVTTYASPEQARGHGTDHRSDIFSLGLILFELLTGHRVRRGTNGIEIAAEAISGTVPRLSALVMTDPELDQIVMHAVAHDPNLRYASAMELAEALGGYRTRVVPIFELRPTLVTFIEASVGYRAKPIAAVLGGPPERIDLGGFPALGDPDPADMIDRILRMPVARPSLFVEPLPTPSDNGWGTERTHSNVANIVPPKERSPWPITIGVSLVLSTLMIVASLLWSGSERTLTLESDPKEAKVFLDGRLVGETPVTLEIGNDQPVHVVMDREGYRRLEIDVPKGSEPVRLKGALEPKL